MYFSPESVLQTDNVYPVGLSLNCKRWKAPVKNMGYIIFTGAVCRDGSIFITLEATMRA